jgi:hypothetical protein
VEKTGKNLKGIMIKFFLHLGIRYYRWKNRRSLWKLFNYTEKEAIERLDSLQSMLSSQNGHREISLRNNPQNKKEVIEYSLLKRFGDQIEDLNFMERRIV